jgi:hypothetical protein
MIQPAFFNLLRARGLQHSPTFFTDYVACGNLDPKFFGGLSNILTYRGFRLDIFLQFKKQIGPNYLGQIESSAAGGEKNLPTTFLSRWEEDGDKSQIEKITQKSSSLAGEAGYYFSISSGAYSDASFIRIKTISLSYDIKSSLKKLKIEGLRVYINAQNLFTITKYLGNDPETQNYYGLPPMKTITAGIACTL